MLKHRLSKICNTMFIALCVLFTGNFIVSCEDVFDDYKYDDEYPSWLGASIYDLLKQETKRGVHTYQNYINLIDSLDDYADILARTGSKTLFVADDASFEKFYADNPWGVKRFEDLTKAQMRVILRSSMLDNAYLLDMMSSLQGPTENSCLRRVTAAEAVDTVPYFTSDMLPQHNKYWDRFRAENNGKGLRLALDGSRPMMVHFLKGYLKQNGITDEDMRIIFNGQTRTGDEAFIYQNKILSSGINYNEYSTDTLTITCKNGYVYRMDKVLVPPSNMAEEIRRHPKTKLFSHILDRFSVPIYDGALSDSYNLNYNYGGTPDSVFTLRYLNGSSAHILTGVNEFNGAITTNNGQSQLDSLLIFDPGWNQYTDGSTPAERDMAAIFVPSDEYLYSFFADSTGRLLIDQYAPDVPITDDIYSIIPALDSIPNRIIVKFINNLMQESFVGSVPSKFDKVQNKAFEELGVKPSDVDECIVANNGVIYILNNVFGPADYRAVSAPPLILENMKIMDVFIKDLMYNSYLLAMDTEYSFIVPDNDYFVYYDPVTFGKTAPAMYRFHYDNKYPGATEKSSPELWARVSQINPQTYEIVKDSIDTKRVGALSSFIQNRGRDLLEYLIIVGDIEDGNKYYQTKGFGTIKCEVSSKTAEGIKFYGGEQLEQGREVRVKAGGRYVEDNGITYCTVTDDPLTNPSGIPTPPTQSVNSKLDPLKNGIEEFNEFFIACEGLDSPRDFMKQVFPNITNDTQISDSVKRYSIFDATSFSLTPTIPFFSTYHYTVYVPSNDAMRQVYATGLPTWPEIEEEANNGNLGKAASMMRLVNNVIRYHFQDNSIYVDNKDFSMVSAGEILSNVSFETASVDESTGRFNELTVKTATPSNGKRTLSIRDQKENVAYVLNEDGQEGRTWNVMARDLLLNTVATQAGSIETSAFSVIHQIDRVLLADGFMGYDGRFLRYAVDGEPVDTMTVVGAPDGAGLLEGNKYLVANRRNVVMTDADGNQSYKRVAYLMKPISGSTNPHTQEEYVLDANDEKILITNDGYLVKETPAPGGKFTYEFIDEQGNADAGVLVQVNNLGEVIRRIPLVADGENQ